MSCLLVRARPQMTGPWTSRAIAWTASKSPGEVIGKPASMMSTPRRANWWAISSFSCLLSEIPGDCSPSRRVVSKILTRSAGSRGCWGLVGHVVRAPSLSRFPFLSAGFAATRPPRTIPPEGGAGEGWEASTETTFRASLAPVGPPGWDSAAMKSARFAGLALTIAMALAAPAARPAASPLYGITIDRVSHPERLAAALAALPEHPDDARLLRPPRAARLLPPGAGSDSSRQQRDGRAPRLLRRALDLDRSPRRAGPGIRDLAARLGGHLGGRQRGQRKLDGPLQTVSAKLAESYEIVRAAGGRTP